MQYSDVCGNDQPLDNNSAKTLPKESDQYQSPGITLI